MTSVKEDCATVLQMEGAGGDIGCAPHACLTDSKTLLPAEVGLMTNLTIVFCHRACAA